MTILLVAEGDCLSDRHESAQQRIGCREKVPAALTSKRSLSSHTNCAQGLTCSICCHCVAQRIRKRPFSAVCAGNWATMGLLVDAFVQLNIGRQMQLAGAANLPAEGSRGAHQRFSYIQCVVVQLTSVRGDRRWPHDRCLQGVAGMEPLQFSMHKRSFSSASRPTQNRCTRARRPQGGKSRTRMACWVAACTLGQSRRLCESVILLKIMKSTPEVLSGVLTLHA